jgi:hypothetical protein
VLFPEPNKFFIDLVTMGAELNNLTAMPLTGILGNEVIVWVSAVLGVGFQSID